MFSVEVNSMTGCSCSMITHLRKMGRTQQEIDKQSLKQDIKMIQKKKKDNRNRKKKSANQILKQIITPVLKMQEAPDPEKEPLVTAPSLMTYRSCLMITQLRKIVHW